MWMVWVVVFSVFVLCVSRVMCMFLCVRESVYVWLRFLFDVYMRVVLFLMLRFILFFFM